jgi:predicted nuclease with TOPRIM domain
MRWMLVAAMIVVTAGGVAAQDQTNPEELNRKYQDALTQLKAAQDRKNELATENETLKAKVAELEKQIEQAKRESMTFAEQTYDLRVHYWAWQSFLKLHPTMLERWRLFLENSPLAFPHMPVEMLDPANPLLAP